VTRSFRPSLGRGAATSTAALRSALIGSVITGLGGQFALVVSGIVAARMLGPENRGYLALLILIPTALSQLGSLGLPLAVTYEFSRDERLGRGTLRNLARMATGIVLTLVVAHAAILVALVASRELDVRTAAAITLLIIPADSAQLYGLAILQGRRDFTAFNVLRLLPAVTYSALAVAAFLLHAGSLPQFALWFTGSYFAVAALTLRTALRRSPPRVVPEAPQSGKMLRFGLRGLFGAVSPLETLRLDQAIVGLFLSPAALGLYVVGVSFTNLPRFVAQSIGVVAFPHITATPDPVRARRLMWRFLLLSFVVCLAIVIPLEFLAGWVVPAFFGEAFAPAVGIMQILLVSSLFLGARRVLADTSRGIGQPGLSTVAEIVSSLSLVPAIALLAPRLGAAGVALAFTASAAISLVVLVGLVASRRVAPPSLRVRLSEEPTIDGL
jgi:O-antigen/teichoic acid export membrane protein